MKYCFNKLRLSNLETTGPIGHEKSHKINKCSNPILADKNPNNYKSLTYTFILISDKIFIVTYTRSNNLLKGEPESGGIYGSS